MTTFLKLFSQPNKGSALRDVCANVRNGLSDPRTFEIDVGEFRSVPGAPFAYWVSDRVRRAFSTFQAFSDRGRIAKVGLQTSDDFRFLRTWWERSQVSADWMPYAKGGGVSLLYQSVPLMVKTSGNFEEIVCFTNARYPYLNGNARSLMHADMVNFGMHGITWTKSTTSPASFRLMARGTVYSVSGLGAFVDGGGDDETVYVAALMNSSSFKYLLSLSLGLAAEGRKHYEIGLINKNPEADVSPEKVDLLSRLGRRAWSLKRSQDSVNETSHAFLLPAAIRGRLNDFEPQAIESELALIQNEIDAVAINLYGFSAGDISAAREEEELDTQSETSVLEVSDDEEEEEIGIAQDSESGLLAWTVGVAFGRFDWRLATGEREALPEPDPFTPLPTKSPGMLPDNAEPFHANACVLVNDQGSPHDLAHLVEEVLAHTRLVTQNEVRRWLQRDFFAFHLRRYSKSRRKAPIYWPLATTSGEYTLWIYYPRLTSQTIYTAVNDFVEPKLRQIGADVAVLRNKGSARSRDDEQQFETLQAFEMELIELRDTLLKLAPTYKPNHDDGVQISAAPLWPLFRHKPWQKILKDTWAKLEQGDYDWAHLAMNYWPGRVREKCKADRSLAIAHGLEHLYVEPEAKPKKTRGRKAGDAK